MSTSSKQLCAVLAAVLAIMAIAAVTAASALAAVGGGHGTIGGGGAEFRHKPRHISSYAAFDMPSTAHCLKHNELTLRWNRVPRVKWVRGVVKVNGRTVETLRRGQIVQTLTVTGLPNGRFSFSIAAFASDGRRAVATATYQSCVVKPSKKPTTPPTKAPAPTPPATPPAVPSSPGSYSGSSSQSGRATSFYLSTDNTQLLDVRVSEVWMQCAPSKELKIPLEFDEIALNADGSFSAQRTEEVPIEGAMATITYVFSGHLAGTGATGSLREEVSYDSGVPRTCSSGSVTWSASRDNQGSQAGPAPSGSYSGTSWQSGRATSLYVSTDNTQLLDVRVSEVWMPCVPSKELKIPLSFDEIALNADGSFSAERTEEKPIEGAMATITYVFRGHFHGYDYGGYGRLAGTLREEVTYDSDVPRSCSSGTIPWSVGRDNQGSQAGPAPSGSYAGTSWQSGRATSFSVSPDSKHILDVAVSEVWMPCAPSKELKIPLSFDDIPLDADGSFSAQRTDVVPIEGAMATITYVFRGHFHGYDYGGHGRMAGTLLEEVSYDSGVPRICSSGTVPWSVGHS